MYHGADMNNKSASSTGGIHIGTIGRDLGVNGTARTWPLIRMEMVAASPSPAPRHTMIYIGWKVAAANTLE